MDAALAFARNIAEVSYEDIPQQVKDVTKLHILDTLGVMLAGSTAPGIAELVGLVTEDAKSGTSTVLGYGHKVPAETAAFANGAMGHCLDYDDIHPTAVMHTGVTVIPAAFAAAERIGKVSGKEFLTAVALGNDVNCRMGLAVSSRRHPLETGWTATCVMGCFGAAAAVSKLLRLNQDRITSALGIAYIQASGGQEAAFAPGSVMRGMRGGFSSKTGLLAALLAEKGISGPGTCLEGRAGLFNLYYQGNYERNQLTADLGQRFEGGNVCFKPWPCCANTHSYVDAALAIAQEHNIVPDAVEKVTVFVGKEAQSNCEPLHARQNPATSMDAKFSIPFTVATAIVKRRIGIGDLDAGGIRDPLVLSIAQKVVPQFDPHLGYEGRIPAAIVEVKLADGNAYRKRIDIPYGQPENPMKEEDLLLKFTDCVRHSVKPVSRENAKTLIGLVKRLETVGDVRQIIHLCV